MGQPSKKCSKTCKWMAFLVFYHQILSARLSQLHMNGSLEAHNVTALVRMATFYYEAVLDVTKYSKAHNAMRRHLTAGA